MSLLFPLSERKKLIPPVLVFAIALVLAASLSQSVESAADMMRSSTQQKVRGLNGASINIRMLFGIQQTGSFKFYLNIEALP